MSTNSIFNRTVKTNIILYPTDGFGRDGYIAYNNAGFWKENIKPILPKEVFKRPPFAVFRSLKNTPPIWTYYSDGSGRDSYVYYNNGGLKRQFSPLASQNLQNYLREKKIEERTNYHHQKVTLSKNEILYKNKINKIQKDLVNRLYNKYKLGNNNPINNNRYENKIFNTLHRSSSQIIGRQTLEPIKYNLDYLGNTLDRNNNLNNSPVNNICSPKNSENIRFKNMRSRNKNPWYYKREYIVNSIDNKLLKHPKIKCSLETDKQNFY